MQQFIVQASERGQRFDKYLRRRLPLAPSSFIYKMLRKKNITLRGKKAGGNETVEEGDVVALFLSDETIRKFSADAGGEKDKLSAEEADRAYDVLTPLLGKRPVLYEDAQILLIAKPPGVLSQKAGPSDLSANEWLRGYLRRQRKDKKEGGHAPNDVVQSANRSGIGGKDRSAEPHVDAPQDMRVSGNSGKDCREGREEPQIFTPSVCNRLDRNTGGILLCAKTLQGSRMLSEMIRERRIKKTYRMLVHGRITEPGLIEGDLIKDREQNQVYLSGAEAFRKMRRTGPGPDPGENHSGNGLGCRPTVTGDGLGRRTTAPGDDMGRRTTAPGDDMGRGTKVPRDGMERRPTVSEKGQRIPGSVQTFRNRLQAPKVRHAVTVYRPVRTGKETTLVEADLITGRSHQLRVHMASIGHPIVGDPRYGSRPLDQALGKKAGISRIRAQLLWCAAVTFPEKAQEEGDAYPAGKTFRCPEPDWWRRLEV